MTDRYAVFGNPISHSKSPLIHAEFAQQTGQDISYEALLAPVDGFAQSVDAFRAQGAQSARGANVTVPFKQEAFTYATELTERAQLAQAVNTLKFDGDKVLGDNTDGAGLVRDLTVNLACSLAGKRVLLLGAGGAARGVILPLLGEKPAVLAIANRTPDKAVQLARQFGRHGPISGGGYEELTGREFDVVINATSSGLCDELPPLPEGVFAPGALAYDMMYGKETPFMAFARAHGARVADGLGMLVEQAAEAFYLWRGVRPETQPVITLLRK
jgi:shikimate dehydrogenase